MIDHLQIPVLNFLELLYNGKVENRKLWQYQVPTEAEYMSLREASKEDI